MRDTIDLGGGSTFTILDPSEGRDFQGNPSWEFQITRKGFKLARCFDRGGNGLSLPYTPIVSLYNLISSNVVDEAMPEINTRYGRLFKAYQGREHPQG